MVHRVPERPSITVRDVEVGGPEDGWHPVRLHTDRGELELCQHPAPGARAAVVMIGGVGGGWDTPAGDLYPRLGEDFAAAGVCSLRVCHRFPASWIECGLDVRAAIDYLDGLGLRSLGLIGHSFGGAVVIHAAEQAPARVGAVVALATQSWGTDGVAKLGRDCALLLVHGTDDKVLSPGCSELVYERAHEPKRLVLLARTGHDLMESREPVRALVRQWMLEHLAPPVTDRSAQRAGESRRLGRARTGPRSSSR
jgi:pimeloyl-ACP methyl ester carboxylesterase